MTDKEEELYKIVLKDFRTSYDPWNMFREGNCNPGGVKRSDDELLAFFIQGEKCKHCPSHMLKEAKPRSCPYSVCHFHLHYGNDGYPIIETLLLGTPDKYKIKISLPDLILSHDYDFIIRTGRFNSLVIDHIDGNPLNNTRQNYAVRFDYRHNKRHGQLKSIVSRIMKKTGDKELVAEIYDLYREVSGDDRRAHDVIKNMSKDRFQFPDDLPIKNGKRVYTRIVGKQCTRPSQTGSSMEI